MTCIRGALRVRVQVDPRFDYAREEHRVELYDQSAVFAGRSLALGLTSTVPLEQRAGAVEARFVLAAGERVDFVFGRVEPGAPPRAYPEREIDALFAATAGFWRRWLSRSRYEGRWREMVHRSALTLKLLTYRPTGAIVAAPTASLPEQLGGAQLGLPLHLDPRRRLLPLRPAAARVHRGGRGVHGLADDRFRDCRVGETGPLQVLYGVDGRSELPEQELPHLEGYRGSAPVRIGNGAAEQLRLDIYGELIDSVYLYTSTAGRSITTRGRT